MIDFAMSCFGFPTPAIRGRLRIFSILSRPPGLSFTLYHGSQKPSAGFASIFAAAMPQLGRASRFDTYGRSLIQRVIHASACVSDRREFAAALMRTFYARHWLSRYRLPEQGHVTGHIYR